MRLVNKDIKATQDSPELVETQERQESQEYPAPRATRDLQVLPAPLETQDFQDPLATLVERAQLDSVEHL